MARNVAEEADPRHKEAQPPFPRQEQVPAGSERAMNPPADHGEQSYRGSGKLEGKVALITGGDSGIGRAVAIAFAREGADVAIAYLDEDEDAAETERWIREAGRQALLLPGDLGDEGHARSVVDRTIDEMGALDILVNNAAWQASGDSIGEVSLEDWRRIFRTNVEATFVLSQAALPHLPEGGTIINVTSIQAYQPSARLLPYASTKGALLTFTKALSQEAIKRGIRVNAVAPGPVWTPLIPSTSSPEHTSEFGKDTPMGRPGQPAELAPLFVFLASGDSSYITGEVIGATGGEFLS
jgi:NAD(P)-dependent dehydrogenase (short-subunit alcohol dehydrogenase family)